MRSCLILSTRHARPQAAPLVLALTIAVVLGLLGMHTLSGDAMGHGPATTHAATTHSVSTHARGVEAGPARATATAASAATASAAASAHPAASADAAASATTASDAPSHTAMAMVCVLALLAGLLLVRRSALFVGLAPRVRSGSCGRASAARTAPRRPPSQIVLCISRT